MGLLYHIRKHDRLAITKMVTKLTRSGLRSAFGYCLLVREREKEDKKGEGREREGGGKEIEKEDKRGEGREREKGEGKK